MFVERLHILHKLPVQSSAAREVARVADRLAPVALEQVRVVVQPDHLVPEGVIIVDLSAHIRNDAFDVEVWVRGPRDVDRDAEHHTEDLLELVENTADRRPLVARRHLTAAMIDRPVNSSDRNVIESVILVPVGPVRVDEQLELDGPPELLVKVCDLYVHCGEALVRGPGRCHDS